MRSVSVPAGFKVMVRPKEQFALGALYFGIAASCHAMAWGVVFSRGPHRPALYRLVLPCIAHEGGLRCNCGCNCAQLRVSVRNCEFASLKTEIPRFFF
jgi:hypothetical protein